MDTFPATTDTVDTTDIPTDIDMVATTTEERGGKLKLLLLLKLLLRLMLTMAMAMAMAIPMAIVDITDIPTVEHTGVRSKWKSSRLQLFVQIKIHS